MTRQAILDAYAEEIVGKGIRRVTLASVAARAGVSKGGLLYHFPSKRSLTDGLAQRLRDYTDANLARATTYGTARAFLETSVPDPVEARQYWAVITAVRADPEDVSEEARTILAAVFDDWSERLRADVADPVLADIIRLVGDGLYLATVTGLPVLSPARLRQVIDRLVDNAESM